MNIGYKIYKAFTSSVFLSAYPLLWLASAYNKKLQTFILQRGGFYKKKLFMNFRGHPRIWLHAVSVGEVGVAKAIIHALENIMPKSDFILSVSTPKGFEIATSTLPNRIRCIFAPLDYAGSIRHALREIKPDMLIFLETEIWPNWIHEAKQTGIPIAIINGRLSARSLSSYLKIRSIIESTISKVDLFSMISHEDANRLKQLKTPSDKIFVNQNAKFDGLKDRIEQGQAQKIRKILNISNEKVIVAGSTRSGEEKLLLNAYKSIIESFPELILVIAPRHLERIGKVSALVKSYGFSYDFYSDCKKYKRKNQVIIIDTMGELMAIYSAATLVYCGASLVPKGGQNILEPAAWGKPILCGPHMDDFIEAKLLLEKSNGYIPVKDPDDLTNKILYYLNNPQEAEEIGKRACQVVFEHVGASKRHAQLIKALWEKTYAIGNPKKEELLW